MVVWRASLTIRDEQGKTRVMSLHIEAQDFILEENQDPADYIAYYATVLDPLITGAIVDISLTRSVDVSSIDIKRVPLAASDVEEGALFVWLAANEPVQQRIPTFDEDFILPGTDQVDRSAQEVIDLVEVTTIPEELSGDWIIGPSDSRGIPITILKSAKESFKP
jgi:hypothetical protein